MSLKDADLKQPYKTLLRLTDLLIRRGLAPSTAKAATMPMATRLAQRPPAWMTRPGDQQVRTEHAIVEGRGGPIGVRLYLPPGLRAGQPAILYMHGGGFVIGGLESCDYIARGLASRTGHLVASVEYRLAPECPHPGPLDDCEDTLRWLADTVPHGCDPSRIAVAGDSAGGNLAASLALRVRDHGGPQITHQTLVYPFLDGTFSAPAITRFAGAGMDVDTGHLMLELYAPDREPTDPTVSPLHADDLAGLPPALIVTAAVDPLVEDGLAYAERLRSAGVDSVHRRFDRVPHGFLSMPRLSKDADVALDLMATEISSALSAAPEGG